MSNPAAAPNRAILLAAPVKVYSLAGPIPLAIRYSNASTNPIQFNDPARTWEVQLAIANSAGPIDLPFGKIIRTAYEGRVRWSVEDAETIRLAPGAKHDFTVDAGARWPERFLPGRNTLQVKDLNDDPPVLSNPIEIQIEYTPESFQLLRNLAKSPDASDETKSFAVAWVRRLYPKFENTPAGHENAAAWWFTNRSSPAVRDALAAINKPAGAR